MSDGSNNVITACQQPRGQFLYLFTKQLSLGGRGTIVLVFQYKHRNYVLQYEYIKNMVIHLQSRILYIILFSVYSSVYSVYSRTWEAG